MHAHGEGFARTATVSPRVQVEQTTGSTNADLVRLAGADRRAWPHLSVLLTRDQRAGRGRLDRTWTAPAGMALAVSTLVEAPRIPFSARGWISLMAGAAMTRAVAAQLAGTPHSVTLKWPNDVLVDGRKICGILAEVLPTDLDAIVIGTGINTRMPQAHLPVATATSFQALGAECDEDGLLADYLTALAEQLAALAESGGDAAAAGIAGEIAVLCGTLGRDVRVILPDGGVLEGRAEALDEEGRLVVAAGDERRAVAAGDVVHVR